MTNLAEYPERAQELNAKIARVYNKRVQLAQQRFQERTQRAWDDHIAALIARPPTPWEVWTQWLEYATDFSQRSILFWDTLRQRGNNFVAHEQAGKPPVLHFEYETVLDARGFARPANYALVRIIPPAGVTVDPRRRQRRYRAAAVPGARALVGRFLPAEPRRDRVDRPGALRRQQGLVGHGGGRPRPAFRPARDQGPDHPVCVDG